MRSRLQIGALSLDLRSIWLQLKSRPAVIATIVLAMVVGASLVAVAPGSLQRAATEDLRATVTEPSPALRNIRVERRGRIGPGPREDPMLHVRNAGAAFAETQFPPSVNTIVSDARYVVDTGRFQVVALPGQEPPHPFTMFLRFRFQEGSPDHLMVVDGMTPQPQMPVPLLEGDACPDDPEERAELIELLQSDAVDSHEGVDCRLEWVPHFEVMVTDETREAMGLQMGQRMLLSPDRLDPFYFGLAFGDLDFKLVMSISGIVELDDVGDDFWFGDSSLHMPRIQQNADLRIIYATGLASESDYPAMSSALGRVHRRYTWRYPVSPDEVVNADVERLESDLESLLAEFGSAGSHFDQPVVITRLPDLLEDHQEQRRQTLSFLSTGLVGLLGMVVAVVLVLTVLMTERQRDSLVLMRGRGASAGQLILTRTYQALILVVPGAIAGYAMARWLVPEADPLPGYRAVVTLGAVGIVAIVLGTVPVVGRRLGELLARRSGRPRKAPPSRVVMELAVTALTVGTVILLRRRGPMVPGSQAGQGFDLLLAAAPLLVAVTVGLLTMRLFPGLVRGMAWAGSHSRGLVPLVGFRRILQQTLSQRLPILVIILCVSTAAFSLLSRTTISEGQLASSWQEVGGDYSISNFTEHAPIPTSVELGDLVESEEMARGATFDDANVVSGVSAARTTVLAIETSDYERVSAGTPGSPKYPDDFDRAGPGQVGTDDAPIPAIVSRFWPAGLALEPGERFVLDMGRNRPTLIVAEVRDRYPGLEHRGTFVVVDLDLLQQSSDLPVQPTVAYLRAPASAETSLTQRISRQSSAATLTSRYETLERLRDDPLVSWVQIALGLLFVFAVGLAAVTAVSSLALGAAPRARDYAFLRTMGTVRRQALAMTVIEQLPSLIVSTVAGTLAGLSAGWILEPAIDFAPFIGGGLHTAIRIDWSVLALGMLALALAVGAGVSIFLLVLRDDEVTHVLRLGEEG